MSHITTMYNYLQQKPAVGMISGMVTGVILKVQNFLTDDFYLKVVSGIGAYASCLIAIVALIIQFIKFWDIVKIRIKIK